METGDTTAYHTCPFCKKWHPEDAHCATEIAAKDAALATITRRCEAMEIALTRIAHRDGVAMHDCPSIAKAALAELGEGEPGQEPAH